MARSLQSITLSALSSRIVTVDCRPQLDATETLTAIAIDDADGTTITNEAVSTTELVVNGETVATGKAVQFLVVAPAAGSYNVVISLTTDSSPVQTHKWNQPITVV